MSRDQRKFPRLLQPFTVQYRVVKDLSASWREVTTVNLSAGGMRLRCADAFDLQEILEIQVQLPNAHQPLRLRGRVVWTEMQAAGVTENGIEFMGVTPEQQVQIDNVVQFFSKTSKPRTTPG